MIDLIVDFLLIPHLHHMQLLNDEEPDKDLSKNVKRLDKYNNTTQSKVLLSFHNSTGLYKFAQTA